MSDQSAYTKVSRKEAMSQGLKTYFTDKPCPKGHNDLRTTANATCVECARLVKRVYYSNNKSKVLAKNDKWRKANLDKINVRSKEYVKTHRSQRQATTKKYRQNNKAILNASYENRRASKINATPKWSDLKAIKQIYVECEKVSVETGIEHHVDHIIPLIHPLVCGLHVPWNLQIITAEENLKKGNKFEIE